MNKLERKEIGPDLLGLSALNPFKRNNSSPRDAMYTTHLGQAPAIIGAEPKRIIAGPESEYAKREFDIRFPCHATVLKVIRKYPVGVGRDSIRHNPITTILYEDYYDPHKTIGVINVPDFASFHPDFGFPYTRNTNVWDRMSPGATFQAGEVICRTPAGKKEGMLSYGVEAESVFLSLPGTIEDGFEFSESFAKKISPYTYTTLVGGWGRKRFPLNTYGDENNYKVFPDIGEYVRDDGIVFASRDMDDNLGVAEMSPHSLRTVDMVFDHVLWVKPGSRVVDIQVYHDTQTNPAHTPVGMESQARRYYDTAAEYYQTLMSEYRRLRSKRGDSLRITPAFNDLLVEAQLYLPTAPDKRKLQRVYRLETLDEYRVEITFEYQPVVSNGFKATESHGGVTL